MKKIYTGSTILIASVIFFACQKEQQSKLVEPKLPSVPFDYTSIFSKGPEWFKDYRGPKSNQLTNNGATLGRVLFYDQILSRNNSVSCASCHRPQNAFGDFKSFSTGFDFRNTARNAMPIINASQESQFFWDCRVTQLENMVLKPVQNHVEMGMDDSSFLVQKLSKLDYYPPLFDKAFGSPEINPHRIADALAQFVRSMVSFDSKYDEGVQSNFANFSESELRGRNLFMSLPCQKCHTPGNFGGTGDSANIGLDVIYSDEGFMEVSGNTMNSGDFKIPSLRNVALTAPYMHDGRFKTLEDVLRFYSNSIQPNANLSFPLNQNATVVSGGSYGSSATTVIITDPVIPVTFNLTDVDIKDLTAFLNTLTDYNFITAEKYSDPFR